MPRVMGMRSCSVCNVFYFRCHLLTVVLSGRKSTTTRNERKKKMRHPIIIDQILLERTNMCPIFLHSNIMTIE